LPFLNQDVIRPLENPIKETGHIQILYGNLAPNGSVAKITGKEGIYFSGAILCSFALLFLKLYVLFEVQSTLLLKYLLQKCFPGPALVFEGEESMLAAISEDPLSFKVCVLVGTVV